MPRHYTPQEKSAALTRLAENRGNVLATALQLGIKERTLRYWQRKYVLENPILPNLPPSTPSAIRQLEELPPFEDDYEAVSYLRKQMLDDLLNASRQMHLDLAVATPYQRMIVLPQLIDRFVKLGLFLKPYEDAQEQVIYRIADSDGQEPDEEPDERMEFTLEADAKSDGNLTAKRMTKYFRESQAAGITPKVTVEYWRRINNDDDYWLEWTATLDISVKDKPPEDLVDWSVYY